LSRNQLLTLLFAGFAIVMILCPELAHAQFAGGLENKVQSVTNGLINFLLPAASVLGIVYAAILAATGDASAKQRMVLVIIASIVGFLAPLIIRWLQGMAT
jgi:type IV secretory pathway VirB2 component (pilin)